MKNRSEGEIMEHWISGVMENRVQFASLGIPGAQRAHVILAQGNALGIRRQRMAD